MSSKIAIINNKDQTNNSNLYPSKIINESKNLCLMKKGDYSVHILVEEVKSLIQLEKDHLPYPIVKLTCFNKSQRTDKTKMPCDNYIYDEHFYFEKENLTVEQLDSSKIIVEVYDASNSKRKDYFGIYEFDIEYIYSMENHTLNNHWLMLCNPESKDMTAIRGYLKLSISVLHDSDPRMELKSDPDSSNCLVPSQTKPKYEQLKIFLIKGQEFPDMDSIVAKKTNRECDPYIEFQYFGLNLKSKIVKNIKDEAKWNQIIYLPVHIPIVSQKIVLLVKDYDAIGSDDNIGSLEINLNDIIGEINLYENYKFYDIYGSHRNSKDKYCNLMNTNAEIGSSWNGRILLKIEHYKEDTPIIKTTDIISKKELDFANNIARPKIFTAIIKLYSGYYLPEQYDRYRVRIEMENNKAVFVEKKTDKSQYIEWRNVQYLSCYRTSDDINDLPDIFFYLLNPDEIPVCFQRIKASEFYLNQNIMIIKLFPELSYGKVSSITNAGLLKVKIFLYNATKDKNKIIQIKDGDSEEDIIEDLEKLQSNDIIIEKKKYTIVCIVYMCRYLISNDKDGNNDPYVRITCDGNKKETSIKHGTINGIWNEKLIFNDVELDLEKKSTWPILLAEIFDYARIGKDDLIGNRFIWLSRSSYSVNNPKFIEPKWSQLYLSKSNIPQGELLLSFYLFDSQHMKEIKKINPKPETTNYSFDINILGLRDMKPLSLLPIRKSFIKFELNSLNVTGDKDSYNQSKSTQPKDKGSNPTINAALKFNMKLPKNEIFMPQLQCIVYDHILSGLFNPILGVFLINIKKLIKETNQQIDEDQKITKQKINLFLSKGDITHAIGDLGNLDKVIDDNKEQDNIIDTSSKPNIEEKEEIKQDEVIQLDDGNEIKVRFYDNELIEKNKNNSEYFVVLPQYKDYIIPGTKNKKADKIYKIEDESKAPSNEYYLPLGYNEKPNNNSNDLSELIQKNSYKITDITKHYRRYYKKGLESIKELNIKSPFYTEYIRRGKENEFTDETAIFTSLTNIKNKIIKKFISKPNHKDSNSSEESDKFSFNSENEVNLPRNLLDKGFGKFKAVIRICESEKMNSFEKSIEKFKGNEKVLKELKYREKYDNLTKSILVSHEVIIRVYILELRDLPSSCDPYIKIFFGDQKKFDEQKNQKKNESNSKWYKCYDILTVFPGESTLRVEAWNYNAIFKDELIGSTSIDLEDRYFSHDWKKMKLKPIETRPLFNPDFSGQQGNLLLWVEIFDQNDSINKRPWNISPEPISKLEIRLVIWDAEILGEDLTDANDMNDVYITSYIDQKNQESTDIHFRCTALASFNWRIVFQLDVPRVNNKLTLHCYDKDLLSRDTFMFGAEIDLSDLIKIANNLNVPMTFTEEYVESVSEEEKKKYEAIEFCTFPDDKTFNKFWVQCYKNNQKSGRILCSLEILPMWKASLNKVGKGREEPNNSPVLLPPPGRLKWSFNPLTWINQFVGPRLKKKVLGAFLMVYLIIFLIRYLPSLVLELGGKILNPFNYI